MNLILSPHFDDAALSLGGLLSKEGGDTVVATFFAGTPATPLVRRWDLKCGFADSTEAMVARAEEDRKSLGIFGVAQERIRNYGYLDAEYRFKPGEERGPEPELEASLRKNIGGLVEEFAAQPLNVFLPGLTLNGDHALVKAAALAVHDATGSDQIRFFFYQDIPYAFKILEQERKRSVVGFFTRKDPRHWHYALLGREITRGAATASIHPIELTRADMEKKAAGVAAYISQVSHLGEGLLEKIELSAKAQAAYLSLPAPYCEVAYAIASESA